MSDDEKDAMRNCSSVCWGKGGLARETVHVGSGTSGMRHTEIYPPGQEPLEAQVIPGEAWTFY